MSDRLKDLLAGLVIIGVFLASRLTPFSVPVIFYFVTLFAILFHGQIIGKRLFPHGGWTAATGSGLVLFFGLQSLAQTAWFYAGRPLGSVSDIWTALSAILACHAVLWILPPLQDGEARGKTAWDKKRAAIALVLAASSLASLAYVAVGAARAATIDAIRTPWPLLPAGTLLAVALAWLAVAVSGWLVRSAAVSAALSALAIFATTAITPLLYRLGFGFDGFLHTAAERIILATGALTPKPLYYMGQYVFTTWLSRAADIPIERIDRWLVPAAAAALIPLAVYVSRRKKDSHLLPFALLLFPLASFVATTPQAFAYVLGLAALLLCRGFEEASVHPLAPIILASWSIAVHPLAGVPFFFIALALICSRQASAAKSARIVFRALSLVFAVLAAVAVPVLFYFLSLKGGTAIQWDLDALATQKPWIDILNVFTPWIGNSFVVWPAWASIVLQALPAILLAAAIAATVSAPKNKRDAEVLLIVSAILLFLAGVLLKTAGDFAFLIDYERGNYADRLGIIAILCLLPAAMPAVARALDRAREAHPLLGAVLLAASVSAAAGLSYDALPRHDALVTGRGWSVGLADIETVRAIERESAGRAYTVLANQSVSAAAVSQFGFKRYNGDIFYYPIPTGGALYEVYLKMTYGEPSRDTAADAATLGGSDLVYVVLNDYWWNADRLAESLSAIADKEWLFGETDKGLGRAVRVYAFDVSKPSKRPATSAGS